MPSHQSKAQVIHNFGETLILAPLRKVFNQKILWVREYQPRYGDEEVLRLAELLMEKGCSSTITMVGPKRETLATRWNSPWPTNVQFQDRLAPEEWHALALEHSLFLNTSHVDSFPISVIQALALGLPVLSTPVGGIPEMIEHETSGWLLEIGQLEGMAHIIQRLEKNGTILGTMSEAALNRAKLFTWEAIAPQWLQLMDTFH
ncbi:MAG TPA: hypothetical protein DCR93_28055 [Cytophagales bacterium]|nr:hypothetical protein [Cytophagales bacterium]